MHLMINNCNLNDIDKIIKLGSIISKNFKKTNNLEEIIKNKEIIGYYEENKLIGFIIYKNLYGTIDILYIVVDKIYRRKNIATKLMNELINKNDYKNILLEVRCDNKLAIKLYNKFNFKIINIRKNYYDNIDAYVMELRK